MSQITQISQIQNDPRTYAIIGAAMEVHRVLGPGFLEVLYHNALEKEFAARGIPAQREVDERFVFRHPPKQQSVESA